MIKFTLREAQKQARMHGMTIRRTGAEDYRINFKNGPESHAAYEETVIDALDTARVMYENKRRGVKHYWVV